MKSAVPEVYFVLIGEILKTIKILLFFWTVWTKRDEIGSLLNAFTFTKASVAGKDIAIFGGLQEGRLLSSLITLSFIVLHVVWFSFTKYNKSNMSPIPFLRSYAPKNLSKYEEIAFKWSNAAFLVIRQMVTCAIEVFFNCTLPISLWSATKNVETNIRSNLSQSWMKSCTVYVKELKRLSDYSNQINHVWGANNLFWIAESSIRLGASMKSIMNAADIANWCNVVTKLGMLGIACLLTAQVHKKVCLLIF